MDGCRACFDGSSQDFAQKCGAGVIIELNQSHHIKLWLNYGNGSKMKDELLALYGLVFSTSNFGIPTL